jgi:hypothetical protein
MGTTRKLLTNIFIYKSKLIHGNLYDYSFVNYINNHDSYRRGSQRAEAKCQQEN